MYQHQDQHPHRKTRVRRCYICNLSTGAPEHDAYHRQVIWERDCYRRIDKAAEKLAQAIAERFGTLQLRDYADRAVEQAIARLGLQEPPPPPKTVKRKAIGNGKRRRVWDRDGWTCQRCGSHVELTVDHIIPLAAGGTDDDDNLQTLCFSCNASKGARL